MLVTAAVAFGSVQAEAGEVILLVQARVGAGPVDLLETIACLLMGFDEPAVRFAAAPGAGMQAPFGITAVLAADAAAKLIGNRRGEHVDCAADGVGPFGQQGRAFENFHAGHAAHGRKIVRGWVSIRSGRHQDAVFHQRDLAAAFRAGTANADVRPQTQPFLFDDIGPPGTGASTRLTSVY